MFIVKLCEHGIQLTKNPFFGNTVSALGFDYTNCEGFN